MQGLLGAVRGVGGRAHIEDALHRVDDLPLELHLVLQQFVCERALSVSTQLEQLPATATATPHSTPRDRMSGWTNT